MPKGVACGGKELNLVSMVVILDVRVAMLSVMAFKMLKISGGTGDGLELRSLRSLRPSSLCMIKVATNKNYVKG